MMRLKGSMIVFGLALMLVQSPEPASGQGKGGGKDKGGKQAEVKGGGKGQDKVKSQGKSEGREKGEGRATGSGRASDKEITRAKGRSDQNRSARADDKNAGKGYGAGGSGKAGNARAKFMRPASHASMPDAVRRFATSNRAHGLVLAAAVSHAFARGRGSDFRIDEVGDRLRIANRKGDPLVFINENDARDLGRWDVDVIDDGSREGSPAFCRSGAGHPVWGRQWCIEKGFGLGSYEDYRWGHTTDIGQVEFSRAGLGTNLIASALANMLGPTAFNRLALHAVTLGLVEPLVGRWVSQPTGSQLLMVNSGPVPVAEFVDVNRDYRADNMLVALRPWGN
ncbi:MAG TPA: hypothetical protein VM939_03455 [Gemmatimonadaceae bacterium]|nr:hypothetical protein [Gemmatimonadaceae bacterium]